MSTRECLICGKQFTVTTPRKIYCSQSCNTKAKYRKIRERRIANRGEKNCIVCGKSFLPLRSDQRYCSTKCSHHDYHKKHKVEINQRIIAGTKLKLATDKAFRKEWFKKSSQRKKRREIKNKEMLLILLGNKCEICGIDIPSILAVHHVNQQKHDRPQDSRRYTYYLKQFYAGEPLRLLCFNHHALLHQGKLNGDIKQMLFGDNKNDK